MVLNLLAQAPLPLTDLLLSFVKFDFLQLALLSLCSATLALTVHTNCQHFSNMHFKQITVPASILLATHSTEEYM